MVRSLVVPLLVATAFAYASTACGGGGSGSPSTDASTTIGSCASAEMPSASAPVATVRISGLEAPTEAGWSLLVSAPGVTERAVPAIYDAESGNYAFAAPVSPETADVTTRWSIALTDAQAARCDVGALAVDPLPAADPSAGLAATADLLQSELDTRMAEFGIDRADLDAVDALDDPLLPLALAQRVLDDPANPNSLRAIITGSAPDVPIDAATIEFFDRLLTAQNQVAEDDGFGTVTGELLVDCGASVIKIETSDQLSCWMNLSNDANTYLASPAASRLRAAVGVMIGVAGVFTGGSAAVVAGISWFVLNQIVDAVIGLAPSELTKMRVTLTEPRLCNDGESGEIANVRVSAKSRGWTITLATIVDGMLSFAGAGFVRSGFGVVGGKVVANAEVVAKLGAPAANTIGEGASQVVQILNTVLVNTAGLVPGGAGDLIRIDPAEIGPITLELDTDYEVTNPDGLLQLSETTYTRGDTLGVAGLLFRTVADRFGKTRLQRNETVEVDQFRIEIDPVLSKPGGSEVLTAEVKCFEGMGEPRVIWTTLGTNGGAVVDSDLGDYVAPDCDDSYCSYPGEVQAQLLDPNTRFSEVVVVSDCCDPVVPLNCTREERCACDPQPSICIGEIAIAGEECVTPGSTNNYVAYSDFAERPDDLVWSVSAEGAGPGSVDAQGVFVAPPYETVVTIRVYSEQNPDNVAVQQVQVLDSCGAWSVLGGGTRFTGATVSAPLATGIGDEEAYVLTFTQADTTQEPTGTLLIQGHPGRNEDCVGATGVFVGQLSVGKSTEGFLAGDELLVTINRFDLVSLDVSFSGTGIWIDTFSGTETPTIISGTATLAGSGCLGETTDKPGPTGNGGEVLGAIQPDASSCTEVLEGGPWTPDLFRDQICSPDPTCTPDVGCPDGAFYVCDASSAGSAAGFPQIIHFYPGGELTEAEAAEGCTAIGGQRVGP